MDSRKNPDAGAADADDDRSVYLDPREELELRARMARELEVEELEGGIEGA